jgi:hypothetical protein
VRFITRSMALSALLAVGCVGTADAAATPSTGGAVPTVPAPAPVTAPAPTPPGAVAIPAGMRTTNGVKAKRYKGTTLDGRTAYFARVPLKAPAQVQTAIVSANTIVGLPYKYGGGHARLQDSGYDCSGTVSFALIGAGLLDAPLSSYEFDGDWKTAEPGAGSWISVYGNQGHAYAIIAGLRLDTSAAQDPSGVKGPQWRPDNRKDSDDFAVVHPSGL